MVQDKEQRHRVRQDAVLRCSTSTLSITPGVDRKLKAGEGAHAKVRGSSCAKVCGTSPSLSQQLAMVSCACHPGLQLTSNLLVLLFDSVVHIDCGNTTLLLDP